MDNMRMKIIKEDTFRSKPQINMADDMVRVVVSMKLSWLPHFKEYAEGRCIC